MQAYVSEPDVIGATALTKSILQLTNIGAGWRVGSTQISATQKGYVELSAIMDFDEELNYGLVNNLNKTAGIAFLNTAVGKTINTVFISTGTAMVGAAAVDWVRLRNSTTGIEPTATIV